MIGRDFPGSWEILRKNETGDANYSCIIRLKRLEAPFSQMYIFPTRGRVMFPPCARWGKRAFPCAFISPAVLIRATPRAIRTRPSPPRSYPPRRFYSFYPPRPAQNQRPAVRPCSGVLLALGASISPSIVPGVAVGRIVFPESPFPTDSVSNRDEVDAPSL